MGIFSSPNQRLYVPPINGDGSGRGTLLGGQPPQGEDWLTLLTRHRREEAGRDPNVVLAKAGPAAAEVQIAQQRPTPASPPVSPPQPTDEQLELISEPGRGYGKVPQATIERDMKDEEKRINRAQALLELAGRPLPPDAIRVPLPDDWERTKPSEIVDDIRRAAERHGVPIQLLARFIRKASSTSARISKLHWRGLQAIERSLWVGHK